MLASLHVCMDYLDCVSATILTWWTRVLISCWRYVLNDSKRFELLDVVYNELNDDVLYMMVCVGLLMSLYLFIYIYNIKYLIHIKCYNDGTIFLVKSPPKQRSTYFQAFHIYVIIKYASIMRLTCCIINYYRIKYKQYKTQQYVFQLIHTWHLCSTSAPTTS